MEFRNFQVAIIMLMLSSLAIIILWFVNSYYEIVTSLSRPYIVQRNGGSPLAPFFIYIRIKYACCFNLIFPYSLLFTGDTANNWLPPSCSVLNINESAQDRARNSSATYQVALSLRT